MQTCYAHMMSNTKVITCGIGTNIENHVQWSISSVNKNVTKIRTVVRLAPPHIYRLNGAERTIHIFNNHFVAGLASVDKKIPIYLWCQILKQEEITISLLRTSRTNPRLSAYAQIFGKFDFKSTPMAPPGTKIIAHEKSTQRATRSKHRVGGGVYWARIGTIQVLQSICYRHKIRKNFWRCGILPSKCDNARSVIYQCRYASSVIFSGSVKKYNAKRIFYRNQWHKLHSSETPWGMIQYHSLIRWETISKQ